MISLRRVPRFSAVMDRIISARWSIVIADKLRNAIVALLFILVSAALVYYNVQAAQATSEQTFGIEEFWFIPDLVQRFERFLGIAGLGAQGIRIAPIAVINMVSVLVYGVLILIVALCTRAIAGLLKRDWKAKEGDKEKWCDSIYYLGFLLTLCALIVTLSQVDVGDGAVDVEQLSRVIAGNAVALSSTVVGLAMRILSVMVILNSDDDLDVTQALEDFENANISATRTLHASMANLSTSMATASQALLEVANNTRSTVNDANKRFAASVQSFSSKVDELERRLSGIEITEDLFAKHIRQAVSEVLKEAEASFERFTKTVDDGSSTLKQNIEAGGKDVQDALTGMVSNVQTGGQALSGTLQTASSGLSSAAEDLRAALVSLAGLSHSIDLAMAVDSAAVRAVEPLHNGAENAGFELADAARKASGHFEEASRIAEKSAADMRAELRNQLDQNGYMLETLRSKLEDVLKNLEASLDNDKVQKHVATEIGKVVEPAGTTLQSAVNETAQSLGDLSKAAETAGAAQKDYGTELGTTAEHARAAGDELLSLAELVGEELHASFEGPDPSMWDRFVNWWQRRGSRGSGEG